MVLYIFSLVVSHWRIKIQFSPVVTDVKIENKSIFFAENESLHTINRISFGPQFQKYRNIFFHRLSIH